MNGRFAAAASLVAFLGLAGYLTLGGSLLKPVRTPPSIEDGSEWQWITAEPGSNIYLARTTEPSGAATATVWVDHHLFATPVGVDTHLMELREFDCTHHLTRRMASGREYRDGGGTLRTEIESAESQWRAPVPERAEDALLSAACARFDGGPVP